MHISLFVIFFLLEHTIYKLYVWLVYGGNFGYIVILSKAEKKFPTKEICQKIVQAHGGY